ncbi:MAG: monofunctional biosynthetic peptidoglycan transglycosylase [Gemmobacter sp.]|nr:monofunctional biosynthetic peptidoglycan transglycosylase [Gemmobacter sp.]
MAPARAPGLDPVVRFVAYLSAMTRTPRSASRSKSTAAQKTARRGPVKRGFRFCIRWAARIVAGAVVFVTAVVLLFAVVNPPQGIYMRQESSRLGGISRDWVDMDEIAPVMGRSVVAAEDANFCNHWGFDMAAIRAALDAGSGGGASTISQQVVKNVFLWHGRSWTRKALEALITPVLETFWSKRRILEVYLNVAEFGEGVFGVKAAAEVYFKVEPADLTADQAARLASVLPDPKRRSVEKPGPLVRRKTARVIDGAETILRDGRAACFER